MHNEWPGNPSDAVTAAFKSESKDGVTERYARSDVAEKSGLGDESN